MSAAAAQGPSPELFFEAIRTGDAERVGTLLDAAPSLLKAKAPDGATPVLFALYWGKLSLVALFEQRGALLDLCEACAAGRRARVETLLDRAPMLVNNFSSDGYPPLGLAVFFGHDDIAERLLAFGADVNAASRNAQHVSPLHAAVARRNPRLVKELLKRGANPNAEQAGGFTPLHGAAYHGDRAIAELLLAYKADAQRKTKDGKTPADLARETGNDAVADLLDQLSY